MTGSQLFKRLKKEHECCKLCFIHKYNLKTHCLIYHGLGSGMSSKQLKLITN